MSPRIDPFVHSPMTLGEICPPKTGLTGEFVNATVAPPKYLEL